MTADETDTCTAEPMMPAVGPIGIWTAGFELLSPAEIGDTLAELEDLGFGAVWFGEAHGREAFTQASLLLSASRRLVVATGIANIWARDAMAGADHICVQVLADTTFGAPQADWRLVAAAVGELRDTAARRAGHVPHAERIRQ
jgi:hypothetical protein